MEKGKGKVVKNILSGHPHTILRNIQPPLEPDVLGNESQQPESLAALAQKQLCERALKFEQVKKSVTSLPRQWSNQPTSDGNAVQVCKTSQTELHGLVVIHSIIIYDNLSWKAYMDTS